MARLSLGTLAISAAACSAPAPAGSIAFLCRVEGAAKAPLTADALCARMRAGLAPVLSADLVTVDALAADARDWVRVNVRIGPARGVLSGRITQARAGAVDSLPEVSISQSDRPLGLDTADMLAGELAAQVRQVSTVTRD